MIFITLYIMYRPHDKKKCKNQIYHLSHLIRLQTFINFNLLTHSVLHLFQNIFSPQRFTKYGKGESVQQTNDRTTSHFLRESVQLKYRPVSSPIVSDHGHRDGRHRVHCLFQCLFRTSVQWWGITNFTRPYFSAWAMFKDEFTMLWINKILSTYRNCLSQENVSKRLVLECQWYSA